MLVPISLDRNWTCSYAADAPAPTINIPVPSLAAWSFDTADPDNNIARLKRSFTLEPVDFCVNYILHLDSVPANTVIFVNGEKVGEYLSSLPEYGPLALDVTMFVALEENEIMFHVDRNAPGAFADIYLQAVPCD